MRPKKQKSQRRSRSVKSINGQRLKDLRAETGLSQPEFAEKVGVYPGAISKAEREVNIDRKVARAIELTFAKSLHKPVTTLSERASSVKGRNAYSTQKRQSVQV